MAYGRAPEREIIWNWVQPILNQYMYVHFLPSSHDHAVAYQMKYIAECKMAAFYVSEPKQQLKHNISQYDYSKARIIQFLILRKAIIHYSGTSIIQTCFSAHTSPNQCISLLCF